MFKYCNFFKKILPVKTRKQMNKVNGSNLCVICWWGQCTEKCRGQETSNESSVKDNTRLCNIIVMNFKLADYARFYMVKKPVYRQFDFERETKLGDLNEKNH